MSVQKIYFEMLNKMVKKMTRSERKKGVKDEKVEKKRREF